MYCQFLFLRAAKVASCPVGLVQQVSTPWAPVESSSFCFLLLPPKHPNVHIHSHPSPPGGCTPLPTCTSVSFFLLQYLRVPQCPMRGSVKSRKFSHCRKLKTLKGEDIDECFQLRINTCSQIFLLGKLNPECFSHEPSIHNFGV